MTQAARENGLGNDDPGNDDLGRNYLIKDDPKSQRKLPKLPGKIALATNLQGKLEPQVGGGP